MRFLMIASFADSLIGFRAPLIAAIQAKGLEVHVAAPDLPPDSPLRLQMEKQGLTVHEVPMHRTGTDPIADVRTFFALYGLMRRIRPLAVMGYTIKPVVYGMLAAWMARVPRRFALITGLGYAFQQDKGRSRLQKLVQRLYALALAHVDKVFFQNPDDEALFRERAILKPSVSSCVVNGSGIDVSAFQVSPLPVGKVRFLLIARLLGDKGVREYAQAAKRVRAKHPNTEFALVGWIDSNPGSIAQEELDEWVAGGYVDYVGRLKDVRPAIADSTVYVLPSYREGTPRTVLEAMAMGRPIITTDAPGCRETVVDDENGFLIPVKSVAALEAAMLRFVGTPTLAAEMGQQSRRLAEEKYDVRKVNAIMLQGMGIS